MNVLLFQKRVQGTEIICENLPLYGVVVVVVNVETADTPEIGDFRIEISDMFLEKFIVTEQMYKLFWDDQIFFKN